MNSIMYHIILKLRLPSAGEWGGKGGREKKGGGATALASSFLFLVSLNLPPFMQDRGKPTAKVQPQFLAGTKMNRKGKEGKGGGGGGLRPQRSPVHFFRYTTSSVPFASKQMKSDVPERKGGEKEKQSTSS